VSGSGTKKGQSFLKEMMGKKKKNAINIATHRTKYCKSSVVEPKPHGAELLAGAGTGTFGRSWSRNVEVSAPTPALSPGQLKYRSK
jgi:hypothetical protein